MTPTGPVFTGAANAAFRVASGVASAAAAVRSTVASVSQRVFGRSVETPPNLPAVSVSHSENYFAQTLITRKDGTKYRLSTTLSLIPSKAEAEMRAWEAAMQDQADKLFDHIEAKSGVTLSTCASFDITIPPTRDHVDVSFTPSAYGAKPSSWKSEPDEIVTKFIKTIGPGRQTVRKPLPEATRPTPLARPAPSRPVASLPRTSPRPVHFSSNSMTNAPTQIIANHPKLRAKLKRGGLPRMQAHLDAYDRARSEEGSLNPLPFNDLFTARDAAQLANAPDLLNHLLGPLEDDTVLIRGAADFHDRRYALQSFMTQPKADHWNTYITTEDGKHWLCSETSVQEQTKADFLAASRGACLAVYDKEVLA